MYCFAQQQGGVTKIIVSGLRTPEEVLQLSGIDYMIIPEKIVNKMRSQGTLQGYNDGLSAMPEHDSSGLPVLSDKFVQAHEFRPQDIADVDEEHFASELGMAGLELLESKVQGKCADAEKVAALMANLVFSRE
jgi:hypothetical protein